MAVDYATPRYSTGLRIILYLVSFFIFSPISGIVIFFVLNSRGDAESKAVARNCLIITLVAFALSCVCTLLAIPLGMLPAMTPSS